MGREGGKGEGKGNSLLGMGKGEGTLNADECSKKSLLGLACIKRLYGREKKGRREHALPSRRKKRGSSVFVLRRRGMIYRMSLPRVFLLTMVGRKKGNELFSSTKKKRKIAGEGSFIGICVDPGFAEKLKGGKKNPNFEEQIPRGGNQLSTPRKREGLLFN